LKKVTSEQSVEQSDVGLSLEELIRRGARNLIQKAIEVEVQQLLAEYENVRMLGGARAVVRNGYLPARARCSRRSAMSRCAFPTAILNSNSAASSAKGTQ